MPDADRFQANRFVEVSEGLLHSFRSHDVVPGDVRVTSVDARPHRHQALQALENFGDLLKASAQRVLGASGVFDQDSEIALGKIQTMSRSLDSGRRAQQTRFAICAAKRPGMQYQVIGTQHQGTLNFSAKSTNRLLEEQRRRAGQVDQVVGVDGKGIKIVLLAQAAQFIALRTTEFVRRPLPGAGRKNLKRVTAQAVGALGGVLHPAGTRGMNPDATRSQFWRPEGWPGFEDILFLRHGRGHGQEYSYAVRSLAGMNEHEAYSRGLRAFAANVTLEPLEVNLCWL